MTPLLQDCTSMALEKPLVWLNGDSAGAMLHTSRAGMTDTTLRAFSVLTESEPGVFFTRTGIQLARKRSRSEPATAGNSHSFIGAYDRAGSRPGDSRAGGDVARSEFRDFLRQWRQGSLQLAGAAAKTFFRSVHPT